MKMTIWYKLPLVQSKVDISPGETRTTVIAIVNTSTNMNKQNKHEKKIHLTHHLPSSASPMTSYVKKTLSIGKNGTIIEKNLCQLSKKT